MDTHLQPETPEGKLGILDVKLHTVSGKVLNIEIQVAEIKNMEERVIFYTSKMVTEQIGKSEKYEKIKKVISIIIADFKLIKDSEAYHNKYQLYDIKTGSKFTDVLEINTLELPKLPPESDRSQLWNWLSFLKAEKEGEFTMIAKESPTIAKAVMVLKELSEDERTRLMYEQREKAIRDEYGRTQFVVDKAVKENRYDTAKSMLIDNIPIDSIIKYTRLTQEEIAKEI